MKKYKAEAPKQKNSGHCQGAITSRTKKLYHNSQSQLPEITFGFVFPSNRNSLPSNVYRLPPTSVSALSTASKLSPNYYFARLCSLLPVSLLLNAHACFILTLPSSTNLPNISFELNLISISFTICVLKPKSAPFFVSLHV